MSERRRRELEEAADTARRLMTSENLVEMQRVVALGRELASELHWSLPAGASAIERLAERVELLHQQRVAQALRPCANCDGHVFRISIEHDLQVGRGRLVVCAGCGLVSTFVTRVDQLPAAFGPRVEAPAPRGPFR